MIFRINTLLSQLFVSLLLILPFSGFGQYPLRYIGIESGLSNNSVTCILQDQYGFTWLGTYDGLNRYDGAEFKIFRNTIGDANSLCNNHIKALLQSGNRIYVATEKGLMFLDNGNLSLHQLYYINYKGESEKIDFNINSISTNSRGDIFATSGRKGLLRFAKNDTIGQVVRINGINSYYQAQYAAVDHKGELWLFINGQGLGRYNPTKDQITIVESSLSGVSCIVSDRNNLLWIGTGNGIFLFNSQLNILTAFPQNHMLRDQNISSILCSSTGDIWIGNNGSGINIWNPGSSTLAYIIEGDNANDLRSGAVADIYQDRDQRVWIGTQRGGLCVRESHPSPFVNIVHEAWNPNSPPNNFIRSFCEDEKNNLWIGTDGQGLSCWNRHSGRFETFKHGNSAGPASNIIVSICEDYTNRVWIASFNGGIDRYDAGSRKFHHYNILKANQRTEEKNFWYVYEDKHKRLWAGTTWGGCLYRYNRAKDQFEIFDEHLIDVHALFEDKDGNLWGGDYNRLIQIDTLKQKYQFYNVGYTVRSITQGSGGNLWLGTEGGGLMSFDLRSKQMKRFSTKNGLPSNSVLNIIPIEGKLWCSTYQGLSCFNTQKETFENYFASDGLQSNQFLYGAAVKLRSGELAFGGIKGFTLFYPQRVDATVHDPVLRLTDFKINNLSVNDNTSFSAGQGINTLTKVEIPFDQASLAVSYTALEYSFPEKIRYAYYLEGWDHQWNYVGGLKTANYSRLNEGNYTLRLKATNTAGRWNREIAIKLHILPPFYRTWWAYTLYLVLFIVVIYIIWLYRLREERLKYEVDIANLSVEKEKESNERKLSFFTNVSHEFRTPLTLIINPIKDMLKQPVNKRNEELGLVYRNATRLLGLVDQLLLFRKTENETDALKVSLLNFTEICHEIFACFTHQAKIKKIDFEFHTGENDIPIYADREKIEIALFNLISNAIKFTPQDGRIVVTVKQDDISVFMEISDTGMGISADIGEKLFDKYYQARDSKSLKTGFGIGLYLVKKFIDLHYGSISYQNNYTGGTTFILSLQKGKAHLQDAEFIETTAPASAYVEELMESEQPSESAINNLDLLISDKQTVLVIDDDDELRDYVAAIFKDKYQVLEAADGEIGLSMIKRYLPDVIISDVVMPKLSGMDLCQIIKNDTQLSHIPIILLTGEKGENIHLKGIEEGAVDFLNKPFDKNLLVARVKGIIKNKKELQNYFFNEITLKNDATHLSEENKQFLYKCVQVIENSLLDPTLDVNSIAEKLSMSYSNLYKRIKQLSGQSVNGFIRYVRVRKAAELLIQTNCNVNEAAFRVGFSDVKYFREQFHKQFGLNPSDFIKRHRTAFQQSTQTADKPRR